MNEQAPCSRNIMNAAKPITDLRVANRITTTISETATVTIANMSGAISSWHS